MKPNFVLPARLIIAYRSIGYKRRFDVFFS